MGTATTAVVWSLHQSLAVENLLRVKRGRRLLRLAWKNLLRYRAPTLPIADMRHVVAPINDRRRHSGGGCTLSKQTQRPAAGRVIWGQVRTLWESDCAGVPPMYYLVCKLDQKNHAKVRKESFATEQEAVDRARLTLASGEAFACLLEDEYGTVADDAEMAERCALS
jgi:hypothetical protein